MTMSTIQTYHTFENPTNLNQKQLWLIATSAMLTELNKEFHDTLLPHHIYGTPKLLNDSKQCLLRDWDTSDLKGLNDTIQYLHNESMFAPLQNNWEMLSESEFDQVEIPSEFGNIIDMVRNYQYDMDHSDYAWHYGRCSWVIRHAFYGGLISEEEAWVLLEENGSYIKSKFNSWESFGLSYLIGAQFWKRKEYNIVSLKKYKTIITYLLTNKNSPWLNVKWEN